MMPEARVAAPLTMDVAARIAREVYGLEAAIRVLPGEYDDNFQLQAEDSREFVLKLMHPAREDSFVDMQCRALTHLAGGAPHLVLPRVIATAKGELYTRVSLEDETSRLVWMLSYLPGTTLAETKPHAPELLASLGRMLAEIDLALRDFAHPCAQRFLKWDLSRSNWARDYLGHIADPERRALAKKFLNLFEEEAVPRFPLLRRSVIYGDANDHNALVDPKTKRVVSVIDFGDMHEGLAVGEPAIAAAYAILGKDDPLAAAGSVLAGYHEILPLTEEEIAAFFALMAARLAVSVVNSAHRKSLVPDDPYVTASEAPAWEALERLTAIDSHTAKEYFRAAAGKVAPIAGKKSSDGSSAGMNKDLSVEDSLVARKRLLGGNLSLSYEKPLKIVRGSMQHLYDEAGVADLEVLKKLLLCGGSCPPVVRAIADGYRGAYRRGEQEIGKKYAAPVGEILQDCKKKGQRVGAYIAETLPSVAGQIVFPPNYLAEVYKYVRAEGAVCIADEVQVGFGRLGRHFWGFGTQGVVPDIAVFGKPMGNAFPLAAVVATREIAASFANGMEFFSTFGGNPVACAAGLAGVGVMAR